VENYADLATLLLPELLASSGGAAPTLTGSQRLQQVGTEATQLDFLALLADQEQAVPVLPAHIPPVRQSLPVSGQGLPLPGLFSAPPTTAFDPTVTTQQPSLELAVALKADPKFNLAPAVELQVLEPTIKAVREPRIDVLPPPAPAPVPLPLAAGKPSLELAPGSGLSKESTAVEAPPLPVRTPPLPTYAATLVKGAPTQPVAADSSFAHSPDSPPATLPVPEVEVMELRGLERLPTHNTPVPTTVAAMTITTSVGQAEQAGSIQQSITPAPALELPEQLADSVRLLATRQGGEMRLRLNPPELGHLEVKVTVNDEQTFVTITASNNLSRDVLEQHLGRLRSLLDGAGLSLADAQVSSERHAQDQTPQTADELIPALPETSAVDSEKPSPAPLPSEHGVDLFA